MKQFAEHIWLDTFMHYDCAVTGGVEPIDYPCGSKRVRQDSHCLALANGRRLLRPKTHRRNQRPQAVARLGGFALSGVGRRPTPIEPEDCRTHQRA